MHVKLRLCFAGAHGRFHSVLSWVSLSVSTLMNCDQHYVAASLLRTQKVGKRGAKVWMELPFNRKLVETVCGYAACMCCLLCYLSVPVADSTTYLTERYIDTSHAFMKCDPLCLAASLERVWTRSMHEYFK